MPFDESWHDYNELLILMDNEFIKSWKKEIKNMNEGKLDIHLNTHSYIIF